MCFEHHISYAPMTSACTCTHTYFIYFIYVGCETQRDRKSSVDGDCVVGKKGKQKKGCKNPTTYSFLGFFHVSPQWFTSK